MNKPLSALRRLDLPTLEMIVVVGLISLHDFLLSDAMSLPLALAHTRLAQLRGLDRVVSSADFVVPVVVFPLMVILWVIGRNVWVRRVTIVYLIWVTLRLVFKVALIVSIVLSRAQKVVGVLLTDTVVLWFVIVLLFGAWYWVIDGGGPEARHARTVERFDFAFPQHLSGQKGWDDWHPTFWDYLFLGFTASTQFGLGDTSVLSLRAKALVMIQVVLSLAVVVFLASLAIGLIQ